MPDKPEVSSEVWEHYNLLTRTSVALGEVLTGTRKGIEGFTEGLEDLPQMLEDATQAMEGLKEEYGEAEEEIAAPAEEELLGEEGAEGGLPLPALALPGLARHFGARGFGRAAGAIGDRKMVVLPPDDTQLDILGVLRDIALIGLPFRGTVTKAIGSKL